MNVASMLVGGVYPLVWLDVRPSSAAVGLEVNPQCGWLQGLTMTFVGMLVSGTAPLSWSRCYLREATSLY